MRITLKQAEVEKALLAFVAQSGIGGDAVNQAQVVFTKGRKGNGLTAEIVIGEEPVVESDEDETDAVEPVAEAVTEATDAAPVDPFAV